MILLRCAVPEGPLPRVPLSEAHLSIRLIWPFARLLSTYPQGLPALSGAGIGRVEYASPETRIPHRVAIELLNAAIQMSGDPTLGLRAGELIEPGDFEALEYAARSSANLRDATHCMARYARLMNDAAEITLVETAEHGITRYRVTDGVPQPAAVNDFIAAMLLTLARRHARLVDQVLEVQFPHPPTAYLDEYARVFRSKVTFNAPCIAIVMRKEWLESPMIAANPRISAAFELHVQERLKKLQQNESTSDKVRRLIVAQLSQGDLKMAAAARKLAMSVPTLRRRLEAEGMTYSDIIDKSREQLARQYLCEKERSTTDVVFLLGFSDVPAFHKAFRRWTGMTPAEYRTSHGKG